MLASSVLRGIVNIYYYLLKPLRHFLFFIFYLFILCNSWLVASTTVASSVAYGAQHMQNGSLPTTKILRSVSKNKPH